MIILNNTSLKSIFFLITPTIAIWFAHEHVQE